MYCKTIFFLFIDATLASDNPSHFRKDLLEVIYKLIMGVDGKIRDENYKEAEKQQKYQHYHLKRLINMNILRVKKY